MSPELLASLFGVALSLILSYIPGLSLRWAVLPSDYKRLIMAGGMFLIAAGVYLGGCYNVISFVTCDTAGFVGLFQVYLYALVANQTAFAVSPQPHRLDRIGPEKVW